MIEKRDGKWVLYSKTGIRILGKFDTKAEAVKKEQEIKSFKKKYQ